MGSIPTSWEQRHREALRAWQRGDSLRLWELCGPEIRSEAGRLPDALEHLRQHAFFGVVNAQERYDPTQGKTFQAFARKHIRGAMLTKDTGSVCQAHRNAS